LSLLTGIASLPVLEEEFEHLESLILEVVREQAGTEKHEVVSRIRTLAEARRRGLPGADDDLKRFVAATSWEDAKTIAWAYGVFLDLANVAEENHRIRVLRDRERESYPRPRPESIREAIRFLKAGGKDARDIDKLLRRLRIELVFTAHPTEAKRRTIRSILRRMRRSLRQQMDADTLPGERERLRRQMLSDLTVLWQTDILRPERPTVKQEVERGLSFARSLWEMVPRIYREMQVAVAEEYPGHVPPVPRFLRFGSWIGGDRDGHPFVTVDVTRKSLTLYRQAGIRQHLERCREASRALSMSVRQVEASEEVGATLHRALRTFPELAGRLDEISEPETYRKYLRLIEFRLLRSVESECGRDVVPGAYASADEFRGDLDRLIESVRVHGGERIVDGHLADWRIQAEVFGFYQIRLDVRQDSLVHTEALDAIYRLLGVVPNYRDLSESERQKVLLSHPIDFDAPDLASLAPDQLPGVTRDTVELFRLIAETVHREGWEPFGGHVISMTHAPSDVLAVWRLWRSAWESLKNGEALPHLPIVPLFETIRDLNDAGDVLRATLTIPEYRDYLAIEREPSQMVMIGYSDSTKDGGYFSACRNQFVAQQKLARVAAEQGVRLTLFHGRGGALGRGGGPAARAILSLPPESVDGAIRVTEQGEVLAERYDEPSIAHRHLEQVTWSTLLVTGSPTPNLDPQWIEAVDRISSESYAYYRRFVEQPGFLQYFREATPISEIENLPIGSRPSRRREMRGLADLRAIPWTFAWTQSRKMLPAWLGLGFGIEAWLKQGGQMLLLEEMYEGWPFFSATIDNAELALVKSDMEIARLYEGLCEDQKIGDEIGEQVREEYRRTRMQIVQITRQTDLLSRIPWLRRSIRLRNPIIDPLNFLQVEWIRRLRALPESATPAEIEPIRQLLRMTIQGIASGMRTTG
jgi:phosphoenolpyruvate carboxylase